MYPTDYKLFDDKWASYVPKNNSSTIKSIGCGPTAIANASSLLPTTVADYMGAAGYLSSSGTTSGGVVKTLSNFGISAQFITESYGTNPGVAGLTGNSCFKTLLSHLRSSGMAILLMGGVNRAGAPDNYWTKGGHYILAVTANSQNLIQIYDPGSGTRNGWYDLNTGTGHLISYTRGIWLLNAKSDGKSTSSGYTGGVSTVSIGRSGDEHGGGGINIDTGEKTASLLAAADYCKTLTYTIKHYTANFEDVTTEVTQDIIKTADINDLGNGGYTNLLSYPSLIGVPFVQLKVGNYTFGKYTKESNGSAEKVDFPNYILSMSITKINGQLNLYTILLSYLISTGDDPNLLDRIFSSVGFGKVYITYGDYNSPTFIYKEEEAILTKISSAVNFNNSSIDYTVNATSSALLLASGVFDFEKRTAKPSDVIFELLYDKQYGLTDVFTGMSNKTLVINNNLICTDDLQVEIDAKPSTDPITYLQYLVTCMSASTNGKENVLKDSTYRITIHDDNFGDLNLKGSYFKITKINSSAKALATEGVYEVDIGYPNDNLVMSFNVSTDNSWLLLYNYADSISTPTYTYDIDSEGHLTSSYSPSYAKSTSINKMTETLKTWWTNMTQFPISATLVLKGLVRPTILMTYIRINALFYGLRHDTSGLYIITGQKDSISESGYRTELALTRVAGDSDYIEKVTTLVTSKVLTGYDVTETQESITVQGNKGLNDIKNFFSGVADAIMNSFNETFSFDAVYGLDDSATANGEIYTSTDGNYILWKILRNGGLTEAGTAGMMGNIANEGGIPTKIQNSLWSKILSASRLYNFSSRELCETYITKCMDENQLIPNYNKFNYTTAWVDTADLKLGSKGSGSSEWGYGLCQWTSVGRKKKLYLFAKDQGKSIGSWELQGKYILKELQEDYPSVYSTLTTSNDIGQCAEVVLKKFEQPKDLSASVVNKRTNSAKEIYSKYAQSSRTSTGR